MESTNYYQIDEDKYIVNSAVYGEVQVNKKELMIYKYSCLCFESYDILDSLYEYMMDKYPTLELLENDKKRIKSILILGFSLQSQTIYKQAKELKHSRHKTREETQLCKDYLKVNRRVTDMYNNIKFSVFPDVKRQQDNKKKASKGIFIIHVFVN